MKQILTVVGTRPNFIKITRFQALLNQPDRGYTHRIVHTGQHYDDRMSGIFFEQFGLKPDFWLNTPPGSPNSQIAQMMLGLEKVITESFRPDLLLVVGDVNSTLAAVLTGNKLGIPVAHIESGLRSRDRSMPEEINRLLTDEIADYFFVTEQDGWDNLIAEGKKQDNMFFVGNTMIDTLVAFEPLFQQDPIYDTLGLEAGKYVLMTMHRPATVDHPEGLKMMLEIIQMVTKKHKLVFPIHPRTTGNLRKLGLETNFLEIPGLILTDPLDYFAFQKLIAGSAYVLTDSGGIQEETTFRQIPCLTLRPNTERPVTVTEGTNTLVPLDLTQIQQYVEAIQQGTYKQGKIPKYWDGHATERIAEAIFNNILK